MATIQTFTPLTRKEREDAGVLLTNLADPFAIRIIEWIGSHADVTFEKLRAMSQMTDDGILMHDDVLCLMRLNVVARTEQETYIFHPNMPPLARVVILAIWPTFAEQLQQPQ